MSRCTEETPFERMLREFCEDKAHLLPLGEEFEINVLTGSLGFMKVAEQASEWARAGHSLGQVFGGISGEVGSRATAEIHSRIIREILGEDKP